MIKGIRDDFDPENETCIPSYELQELVYKVKVAYDDGRERWHTIPQNGYLMLSAGGKIREVHPTFIPRVGESDKDIRHRLKRLLREATSALEAADEELSNHPRECGCWLSASTKVNAALRLINLEEPIVPDEG